jgi:hypothetical protein
MYPFLVSFFGGKQKEKAIMEAAAEADGGRAGGVDGGVHEMEDGAAAAAPKALRSALRKKKKPAAKKSAERVQWCTFRQVLSSACTWQMPWALTLENFWQGGGAEGHDAGADEGAADARAKGAGPVCQH